MFWKRKGQKIAGNMEKSKKMVKTVKKQNLQRRTCVYVVANI